MSAPTVAWATRPDTSIGPTVAPPELLAGAGSRRRTTVTLAGIAAVQAALALRPGDNPRAFQDEGLYLFMGHRMIDHLTNGVVLQENPGSFFSGAPGGYPVLAALIDSVGGLAAARALSLVFAILAMLAVYGLGRRLFDDRAAGLFGAAAFAVCGPVIFQSHLATYDAMAMSLFAIAAWLAVTSAGRGFLFGPLVALLVSAAFFTKYATAVYGVGIAALAAAAAPPRQRWTVAVRALGMLASAVVVVAVVLHGWGASLLPGIATTTTQRAVIAPARPADLAVSMVVWVGPWLGLAVIGAVVVRDRWRVGLVLLALSLVGPLQQIRIGESTSLAKHAAFGMVFAAPLIGALLAALWRRRGPLRTVGRTVVGRTAVVGTLTGLLASGIVWSADFRTGWVDDAALVPVLASSVERSPGKVLLGEEPSAQRYELRSSTTADMWADTFEFYYDGLRGEPAYRAAIDQSHFGTIFLTLNTKNGRRINEYLTGHDTPYRLSAQVPTFLRGEQVGVWLVWTPRVLDE